MDGSVKTGISGLDKVLDGGFPSRSTILVSGEAGSGKTLFALNFLVQAASSGERCCYVSLSETEEELLRACSGIDSLKDASRHASRNLIFKHILMGEKTSLEEFTKMFSMYPKIDKLVIDNINKLFVHAKDQNEYRLKLAEALRYLKENVNCSLVLCETGADSLDSGNFEAFEADGLVKLSFLEFEEKPKRILKVYKLRYTDFEPRVSHEFVVDKLGLRLTRTKVV